MLDLLGVLPCELVSGWTLSFPLAPHNKLKPYSKMAWDPYLDAFFFEHIITNYVCPYLKYKQYLSTSF